MKKYIFFRTIHFFETHNKFSTFVYYLFKASRSSTKLQNLNFHLAALVLFIGVGCQADIQICEDGSPKVFTVIDNSSWNNIQLGPIQCISPYSILPNTNQITNETNDFSAPFLSYTLSYFCTTGCLAESYLVAKDLKDGNPGLGYKIYYTEELKYNNLDASNHLESGYFRTQAITSNACQADCNQLNATYYVAFRVDVVNSYYQQDGNAGRFVAVWHHGWTFCRQA